MVIYGPLMDGRSILTRSLFAACLTAPACSPDRAVEANAGEDRVEMIIGTHRFLLEVAADPASRRRGLGGRSDIAAFGGMLFVFPEEQYLAFSMRDCVVPIDLLFLDESGRVLSTAAMLPEPPQAPVESEAAYDARLRAYVSSAPTRIVVELRGGVVSQLDIRAGDAVYLSELPVAR